MLTEWADFYPIKKKLFAPFYILCGKEPLLIFKERINIKKSWQEKYDDTVDEIQFDLENANDWNEIEQHARNISIFSTAKWIHIRYEKKTLDASLRENILTYLKNPSQDTLLLIEASSLTRESLNFLSSNEKAHVIHTKTPSRTKTTQWIAHEVSLITKNYEASIPELIYRYHEGNLIALSSFLEKLALLIEPQSNLTTSLLSEHLEWQTQYALFELSETCIAGDIPKALQFLRQIRSHKTEMALILWILSDLLRKLFLLSNVPQHAFQERAREIKIWSNQIGLYQKASKKYSHLLLSRLLSVCSETDLLIKTGKMETIWHRFDWMVISLCIGKEVPYFASSHHLWRNL